MNMNSKIRIFYAADAVDLGGAGGAARVRNDPEKMAADIDTMEKCIKAISEEASDKLQITSLEGDGKAELDALADNINRNLDIILENVQKMQKEIDDVKKAYDLSMSTFKSVAGSGNGASNNSTSA